MKNGKIVLVRDDFAYNGINQPRKGETYHVSASIADITIDENFIKFVVLPYELDDGSMVSYLVNLLRENTGQNYSGKLKQLNPVTMKELSFNADEMDEGFVKCKMYQNEKGFMLHGTWDEDFIFTWFATIDK